MAILKLEDLEGGSVELLVFPRASESSRYIHPNAVVLVKGTWQFKPERDTPKILVNDLSPFEEIYKLITAININLSGIRENIFESLKAILASSRGNIPIYLHLTRRQNLGPSL